MSGDTGEGGGHPGGEAPFGRGPYDPRKDHMAPPEVPCECFCLHCRRIFMSDQMWFQRVVNARDGFPGFWMCPTPNCGGAGFTFDIFPTDPDHPANDGWQSTDAEEDSEDDGETADEDLPWEDEDEDDDSEAYGFESDAPEAARWDPSETKYQALDDIGDCEEDLEGEEWKFGLEPGERPKVEPPPPGVEPRNWAEQEALYDAPDRRPREVDWSDREDRTFSDLNEDDLPF